MSRLPQQTPARPARAGPESFRPGSRYGIVTVDGADAIPLAITTSVLGPAGVPAGTVNWVADLVPGAIDAEVQLLVRA